MKKVSIPFFKIIYMVDFPERANLAVDATSPCSNGGTPLANGSCACGSFTSGDKCQNARYERVFISTNLFYFFSCQRKGIPEGGDRCYCPPGWYAQFCEIRGCRPPLNDNLNVDKRSFMLILPITPSMADVRTNLQKTLVNVRKKRNFEKNQKFRG